MLGKVFVKESDAMAPPPAPSYVSPEIHPDWIDQLTAAVKEHFGDQTSFTPIDYRSEPST
ncbi:hypothetical protein [Gorillibacterium massiliense]|uniref:hypothetical protein n=1 Tax=Gorillibacterium massiliense TaxID=1280390 RepID=UPI0004B9263D|nr:hypothetical protein [Gorillibacterium massiliense]